MKLIVDIETNGLLDELTTIHCIVAKDVNSGEVHSFRPNEIDKGIKLLESADELIAHNGIKFDVPAIKKLYPSFKSPSMVDTLVCVRLIWSSIKEDDAVRLEIEPGFPRKMFGSHSLKAWGYRLGNHKGDYAQQEAAWDVYSEEMLTYCQQDVEVTADLYAEIIKQNYSPQSLELEHQVAWVMAKQERNGFVFDEKKAALLYRELSSKRTDIRAKLDGLFKPWIIAGPLKTPARTVNYKDVTRASMVADCSFTPIKIVEFNPSSRAHIADRLMKVRGWKPKEFTKSGQAKVDETTLTGIPYPEAKVMAEYFMLQKRIAQLSDGAQGWLKVVKSGKIHGSINPNGAVTGRATHAYPNIAQVPSLSAPYGQECRELFTVPQGWKLMGADASGLELRCLAHYMAAYDRGEYVKVVLDGDIHTTNQLAAGLPDRPSAKRFIYAFNYGGGDQLIGELVGGGRKQGKAIKERFLKKTPALAKLRDQVMVSSERGFIYGLDRRRVHIRSPHSALNALLQSAGGIICKQWLVQFVKAMKAAGFKHGWDGDFAMCAWVHDEIQVACKAEIAEQVGDIAVASIKEVTSIFNFQCPLDGEFNVGDNWAATH